MSSGRTPKMNLHSWQENDYFDIDEINYNFNRLDEVGGTDYIIEHDSSGDWEWIKWHSGKVELFCNYYITEYSNWFEKGNIFFNTFTKGGIPSGVINGTTELIANSITPISKGHGCYFASQAYTSATDISFDLLSATNTDAFTGLVRLCVVGRWK